MSCVAIKGETLYNGSLALNCSPLIVYGLLRAQADGAYSICAADSENVFSPATCAKEIKV